MNIKPLAKTSEILVQELEKELLVYDLKMNKAFVLNETSAMIFQLCDGKRTVAEISDSMSRKLKILVSEDFVWLALKELRKDGLLENSDEFQDYFAGMSRREMVKKVGLASMIALPLVSSVIAPTAANAQSGCLAPGTISLDICSLDPVACTSGPNRFGSDCCSGIAISVNQPCPFIASPVSCACA